jgi:hypothetical protein
MPARMISFDTESRFETEGDFSIQTWRTGSAIRWRNDLKTGDRREGEAFNNPVSFWRWVTEFCRPGCRTVLWAHNLGHDIRISQAFTILPDLGWELEWCNLDRNVSAMTWRSAHGTLVMADTWTWIPLPLNVIAPQTGTVKFKMPHDAAPEESWNEYCMRDAEIVYRVVSRLVEFIGKNHLGNWQPTGAGMAYATWRHKFLHHKILVHDDAKALAAEREAMHTGRAEAWRHGKLGISTWTEVDMRNAYLMIGAECDLPRKLRQHYAKIGLREYSRLCVRNRVLCRVHLDNRNPVAPLKTDGRTLWPIGTFTTWLWDTEVDACLRYGSTVQILEAYVYARDPILKDWANWVFDVLNRDDPDGNNVAQTWIKHCSRALIGRLALRVPSWEVFGANPEQITGISHITDLASRGTHRMMHVGDRTLIETAVEEGRDSLPQVTGWIMAECRVRLWEAMNVAGLDNVAHVDTDSLVVNRAGLARLRDGYGADYARLWQEKGTYRRLEVWGPRCYFRDGQRVTSGVPLRAELQPDGSYQGERWTALAGDLEAREGASVSTRPATWHLRRADPRRIDSAGAGTATEAYTVAGSSLATSSSIPTSGTGA